MFNDHGGSKTDSLIQLVLIFFVSLLSFSVGTYVGKQVSDSDHRRAQIEGDYSAVAKSTEGEESSASTSTAEEEKLSEEDISNLTEEFVAKEKPEASNEAHGSGDSHQSESERELASSMADKNGYKQYKSNHKDPSAVATEEHAPAMAPTTTTPHATGAHPSTENVAHRLVEGQAPAPDPKENRQPLSILPSVASSAIGKYTIQIAAYPDELGAKNHAATLKAKGWNAFYIPAEVQNKTWYRVSVGLFSTAKSAKEFRKELQKEAQISTAIVQKIVK